MKNPPTAHSPGRQSVLMRVAMKTLLAVTIFVATASSQAAITGIVPGSNTAVSIFQVGGVTLSTSGTVPLEEYPSMTFYTDGHPTAGFGVIYASYNFDPSSAIVVIPPNGPTAIASQGAPMPGDGAVTIRTDFSVAFSVVGGLPSFTVPIAYPIAFGQTHPGMMDEFIAEVNYFSANDGPLGTSTLTFTYTGGPGGSPYYVVSGADLVVPALTGTDTLTLSGFFELTADGFSGGSTEIEVFGAPEPSRTMLLFGGALAALIGRRRRTRC